MTSLKAPSPLTILVNGTSGISVTGTLDATTLAELTRSVAEFFDVANMSELELLTLDLSTVSACDHAVSAAVRHAQSMCAERAVALRVVPSEAVRLVMTARR
jgi:ABC-type transporter Mla MlaB component